MATKAQKKDDQPTIINITNIDPGQLLLWSAYNAQHITPELQREIAAFTRFLSTPVMYIKPVNMDLEK